MARPKATEAEEIKETETVEVDLGAAYQVTYSLTELLAAQKPAEDK